MTDEVRAGLQWLEAAPAPIPSTRVTFPIGDVAGRGTVLAVGRAADERYAVVVDTTPFHPLDHTWPDQPADTGAIIRPDGGTVMVVDALTGATAANEGFLLGGDIDVRRGDDSRQWYVMHLLDATAAAPQVGERVTLVVDNDRRAGLSRGHTACHLAAFAFNAVSADCWTKDPERRDSRGNPDLDQSAITVSEIELNGSYDAYRFGKSLRRKGFDAAKFLADWERRRDEAQALLDRWLEAAAPVSIVMTTDDLLVSRRRWECDLPDGLATVPCGGTHVPTLAELGGVRLEWSPTDDGFEVRTHVS